jgi:hypothetical protein
MVLTLFELGQEPSGAVGVHGLHEQVNPQQARKAGLVFATDLAPDAFGGEFLSDQFGQCGLLHGVDRDEFMGIARMSTGLCLTIMHCGRSRWFVWNQ